MGMDPYAHIWYGIDCGEKDPTLRYTDDEYPTVIEEDETLDFYDIGDMLAHRVGLMSPYEGGPERDPEYTEWKNSQPDFQQRVDAYYARKKELEGSSPVEIIRAGCDDGEVHYGLALKGTTQTASWDRNEPLKLVTDFGEIDIAAAQAFCLEHGLPAFSDPKWWVGVSYG